MQTDPGPEEIGVSLDIMKEGGSLASTIPSLIRPLSLQGDFKLQCATNSYLFK